MTNEELKKKIAQIIADYFCPQRNEHKNLWGDDRLCYSKMNFAECEWVTECTDALIAAGIGDVSEYKHRADKAERALHILAKNALYSVMQSDGAFVKLCYGADTAKCNACNEKCSTDDVTDEMLAECFVTESLKQAVKEFAERLITRFKNTETIANCLHGRSNTEINQIIKIVAAEFGVEVEK